MPYNFFYSLSKAIETDINKVQDTGIKSSPRKSLRKSVNDNSKSMKKIKSEEDFVKFHVPWIM